MTEKVKKQGNGISKYRILFQTDYKVYVTTYKEQQAMVTQNFLNLCKNGNNYRDGNRSLETRNPIVCTYSSRTEQASEKMTPALYPETMTPALYRHTI